MVSLRMKLCLDIQCSMHTHHANLTDCHVHKMNCGQKTHMPSNTRHWPYTHTWAHKNPQKHVYINIGIESKRTHECVKERKRKGTEKAWCQNKHATKFGMHCAFYLCISSITRNESTFWSWIWFRQWELVIYWGAGGQLMCMAWRPCTAYHATHKNDELFIVHEISFLFHSFLFCNLDCCFFNWLIFRCMANGQLSAIFVLWHNNAIVRSQNKWNSSH